VLTEVHIPRTGLLRLSISVPAGEAPTALPLRFGEGQYRLRVEPTEMAEDRYRATKERLAAAVADMEVREHAEGRLVALMLAYSAAVGIAIGWLIGRSR
jgi:hypothetical protein